MMYGKSCNICGSKLDTGLSCPNGCVSGKTQAPSWCPSCAELRKENEELRSVLKESIEYIEHDGHMCEFYTNPEAGKCDFCEMVADFKLAAEEDTYIKPLPKKQFKMKIKAAEEDK